MSQGYVYILTHPRMEGLVKIGYTTKTPEERCKEISSPTGVPGKFQVTYSVHVTDCEEVERRIHEQLSDYRYVKNKEFFEIGVTKSIDSLERISKRFLTYKYKYTGYLLVLEKIYYGSKVCLDCVVWFGNEFFKHPLEMSWKIVVFLCVLYNLIGFFDETPNDQLNASTFQVVIYPNKNDLTNHIYVGQFESIEKAKENAEREVGNFQDPDYEIGKNCKKSNSPYLESCEETVWKTSLQE
jgi:hypothetical protein